ncbi:uncharacterized protein A4U43_C03F15990 [Asparagus officinalis]|uniref:Costars domain-containing protein n=1 Tax=Asparagus officinalis TaxID=4686 RepID=A0A5P1FDA6_ASPOF|nr:uncharacterized protein A4U43_C03F15990 [Asparagus officinalis]
MNVEEEVGRLKEEIQRLGQLQQDGSYKVKFGVLFNDDRCANIFEALVGTLRAAKKRKIVHYDGGNSKHVDNSLMGELPKIRGMLGFPTLKMRPFWRSQFRIWVIKSSNNA